jgi:hypothetical protein
MAHRSGVRKALQAGLVFFTLFSGWGAFADSPIEAQRRSEIGPDYRTGPGRFALHLAYDLNIFGEIQVAAAKNFTFGLGASFMDANAYSLSINYYSFEPYAGFYAALRFHWFDGDGTAGTFDIPSPIWGVATTTANDTIALSLMVGWSWHATRNPYSFILGVGPMVIPEQTGIATTDAGLIVRITWAVDFWLTDVFN